MKSLYLSSLLAIAFVTPLQAADTNAEDLKAADAFMASAFGENCTRSGEDAPSREDLPDVVHRFKFRYDYQTASDPENTYMLFEMFCSMGAYNVSTVFLTMDDSKVFSVLSFAQPVGHYDYTDDQQTTLKSPPTVIGFDATNMVTNAAVDDDAQTITSFGKWRGIGDAYDTGTWTFREGAFLLTKYEVDPTFDANLEGNGDQEPESKTYTLFQADQ
jgi:Protein of unknown function (DUF1176)